MLTVKQARNSAAGPNQAEMAGLAARSYHDPGHFLSRTRGGSMTIQAQIPAQRGQRRRILAISDTRHTPLISLLFPPFRRDNPGLSPVVEVNIPRQSRGL